MQTYRSYLSVTEDKADDSQQRRKDLSPPLEAEVGLTLWDATVTLVKQQQLCYSSVILTPHTGPCPRDQRIHMFIQTTNQHHWLKRYSRSSDDSRTAWLEELEARRSTVLNLLCVPVGHAGDIQCG